MDSERHPFEELAAEFASRCRRGDAPSIAEYSAAHPDLADQIDRLFPSIELMEKLREEERDQRVAQTRWQPANPIPKQIGDYRIVREIGRGGMGIVYEAFQESLEHRVAVKVLARQSCNSSPELGLTKSSASCAATPPIRQICPVQRSWEVIARQFRVPCEPSVVRTPSRTLH